MVAPRPVSLVQRSAVAGEPTPEPLGVVGSLPVKSQVTALTAITTPDATDATTVITLANANKAKINAIIAALKA